MEIQDKLSKIFLNYQHLSDLLNLTDKHSLIFRNKEINRNLFNDERILMAVKQITTNDELFKHLSEWILTGDFSPYFDSVTTSTTETSARRYEVKTVEYSNAKFNFFKNKIELTIEIAEKMYLNMSFKTLV